MLLVRGGSPEASMYDYLVREIEAASTVEVRLNTRVVVGGARADSSTSRSRTLFPGTLRPCRPLRCSP